MIHPALRPDTGRRLAILLVALAVSLGLAYSWPAAQSPASASATAKKALTVDDYVKWRNIASQELSGDGNWAAYVLQLSNTVVTEAKPVQHLLNLATDKDIEIANATGGRFSADSRWFAYRGRSKRWARRARRPGWNRTRHTARQAVRPPRATRPRAVAPSQARPANLPQEGSPAPAHRLEAGARRVAGREPRGDVERPLRRRLRRNASSCAISRRAPCNPGRKSSRSRSPRIPPHLILKRRKPATGSGTGGRGGTGTEAPAAPGSAPSATPGAGAAQTTRGACGSGCHRPQSLDGA